jgi:ATP-dependent RNA helicase RhlE
VTFSELNLNNPLLNALGDMGYVHPTPIQKEIFSVVMSGKDVVGIAQTGTGKTFAYVLPLLRQLKFSDQPQPRILIVVPTRELVLQTVGEIEKLSKYMNLRFAGVYGGTNINTQKILVHNGLDILVATPGRLMDLALSGVLRLKAIQKLVIDEVDEMLNLGFRPQLLSIMDLLPPKRQNLLFSATLTDEIENLIRDFFNHPQKIEVAASGTPLEKITQIAYHVPNFHTKVNLLEFLLSSDEAFSKVLVFVESKNLADRIYEQLGIKFPDQIGVIHSNKSQNFRVNSLKLFEDGTHRVLIATDLIARGLDIKDVSHVINFDTPEIPEDYIHRIGRTGRADKAGVAITFINEAEEKYQDAIEKLMNRKISEQSLPEGVVISTIFSDDEKPISNKDYLRAVPNKISGGGAFHEKSEKNSKVNLGGSYKRTIKLKYPKPQRRNNNKKR